MAAPPKVNVSAIADARSVCWRAATELRAIAPAAVLAHIAEGLDAAASALDGFLAELHAERAGEFDPARFPAVEDEGVPDDAPDPARNDVLPDAGAEDAPQDPSDGSGPQDIDHSDDAIERLIAEEEAIARAARERHDALYAEAQRLDIRGRTKMTDAELAEAVAAASD